MNLDANHKSLPIEPRNQKKIYMFEESEAIAVPVELILSAPSRLLTANVIGEVSRSFDVCQSTNQLLIESSTAINNRAKDSTAFVDCSNKLIELLLSVATRVYMMTNNPGEKEKAVASWRAFKQDIEMIRSHFDDVEKIKNSAMRSKVIIELRRLYKQITWAVPVSFRVRYQLGFTEQIFGELNMLIEQCEAYALIEKA